MQDQEKRKLLARRTTFWLSQAEHHIQNRRFYLARRILESIHDPQAHLLLDDLNVIAPPLPNHSCPLCSCQEFTWHRTVSTHHLSLNTRTDFLEVDRKEVYSRVCASCSNVQLFLQIPDWVQLE
jgi:predicted nucleic-acid-binding Zn-ribbon protein